MFSGTLISAYLILVVPLFAMFVFYLVKNDWTSAAQYGAIVLGSLLVGVAVRYATHVNQEECWYASWIFNPAEGLCRNLA